MHAEQCLEGCIEMTQNSLVAVASKNDASVISLSVQVNFSLKTARIDFVMVFG